MIEYLVGRGETEAAGTVAGIFSEHVDPKLKFMTSAASGVHAVCNHFAGDLRPDTMPTKVNMKTKNIIFFSVGGGGLYSHPGS